MRTHVNPSAIVVMVLLGLAWFPAIAQQQKPVIMIVGTAHFDNPGHDLNQLVVDDVLAPTRQAELTQLVATLAQFKPTRIAIENTPADQVEFDRRIQGYSRGTYQLTADERDQIGVRLATLTGVTRLDLVDFRDDPPGPAAAYDFRAYALASGKAAQLKSFEQLGRQYGAEETTYLSKHSLLDWFVRANSSERRAASNRLYDSLLEFDDDKARPAANWMGAWHRRNLAILENIARVSRPNDRILVLFGAEHSYLLDEFALEGGRFEVVDVETYLEHPGSTPYQLQREKGR